MQCQFARGKTTWSVSFHVFLLEEFHERIDYERSISVQTAWLVYKGFTANDIQFAIGLSPARTKGNKAGLHQVVVRWTYMTEPYEKKVPNAYVECFKWMHICVTV